MSSAKRDFEGFVRWMHSPEMEVPPNVRRFANLVLAHFEAIAQTSRQRSQRSVLLVQLARRHLAETPEHLPDIAPAHADAEWPWRRLRHLTIGPFRGFRNPEPFDLQKRIVLFYGPNGSGKTSVCEAFEYALLGHVEEADAKRISPAIYLSNQHERRFLAPQLKATEHNGEETDVVPDADLYRFCFIEKNRIDAFSRIAARPPGQRTELIATLFGMDKFNEFVGHFNESIDGQVAVGSEKRNLLAQRRAALAQDQTTVSGEGASLLALAQEEQALAQEYSPEIAYPALKALMGTPDAPGRLQQLNELLNAIPPQIIGVDRQSLQQLFADLRDLKIEADTVKADLQARAVQVSFKDLYTAVKSLQPASPERCPACDTPFDGSNRVARNPYEKAEEGLDQLSELATLQAKHARLQQQANEHAHTLRIRFGSLNTFLIAHGEQATSLGAYIASLPNIPAADWWLDLLQRPVGAEQQVPTLDEVLALADRVELQDNASRQALLTRQANIEERDRLNLFQLKIQAQDARRQQTIQSIAAARQRIELFEQANARLIQDAAQEETDAARDQPIKSAYDTFLIFLQDYRDALPARLMAGLNESAMALYNDFNRSDHDADKLAGLHLPLAGDGKIELSFRGNPQGRVDALKILSEGHIRCLGLAILLAKNASLNSPLIVFDDAINAIDHDHRRGIRETIFESDYFPNAQIIVTCHSQEFIKDIQQSLPRAARDDCKVYILQHHTGNYQPRVNGNVTSRNYVQRARAARQEANDRAALDASRKAIEMFTEKIWRWLASHEHGMIAVPLMGIGAEPALRPLCEALRAKLRGTPAFAHPNKDAIVVAFDRILCAFHATWTVIPSGTGH